MSNYIDNIIMEDARIIFRNFSGQQTDYNRAGDRNFSVIIDDPELAKKLIEDGWNIKELSAKDEGDEPTYHLSVSVSFKNIPPTIFMVTNRSRVQLNEETVSSLDYAEIKSVDLIISPYKWEVNKKSGVKAYLKTMYVKIEEDPFAHKYNKYEEELFKSEKEDYKFGQDPNLPF